MPPTLPTNILCAAELLEGITLENGWKVIEKVQKSQTSTGGNFSVPYYVEKEGSKKRAFLKALNFRALAELPNFAQAVQKHTAAFNFERDTLAFCKEKGLRKVAKLLDSGEYRPPNSSLPVCYIIFELANGGDARKQLAKLAQFDLAWTLRTLHQIAVGLAQLHTHGVAHQDIKPSNVLFFEAFDVKIGDFGCADHQNNTISSPRGHLGVAGDPTYAPPELFYNEISMDWKVRRLGCDLYLLGSLVIFFFTGGTSTTSLIWSNLNINHKPQKWTQDYRSVLPYVRDAFEQALDEVKNSVPTPVRSEILEIIRYLCEPDPKRRGHPQDLNVSQFNLERVISAFNLLAAKAEYGILHLK